MVITVTCPSCSSSFPVDSAKVPVGGVNARCSSCGDIFRIEKPVEPEAAPAAAVEAAPAPPPIEAPAVPEPEPEPAPEPEVEPEPVAEAPAEVEPVPPPEVPAPAVPAPEPQASVPPPLPTEEPAAPPAAEAPAEAAAAPPAEPAAAPAVTGFTFGKRDPTDKARRLARVLVSDMIMYNAERHQLALENGTIAQDFEEEIEKSWKEFVEQVGGEMAEGPGQQFWIEALNDILAKGEQLF